MLVRERPRAQKKGKRRLGWKLALAGIVLAGGAGVLSFYAIWAQTFDMKRVGAMPERNTVFDVDGKIYSRLAGANRLRVSLNEVSPFFIDAAAGARGHAFLPTRRHRSARELPARFIATSSRVPPKKGQAASRNRSRATASHLVAARLVGSCSRRWWRCGWSGYFTKEQILELYVNRIYFGSGCYGVETASQAYFGKSASKLNLSEAALLAGLIRSPNRFSPLKNPEGAAVQRDTVLDRMLELKKISAAQAAAKQR